MFDVADPEKFRSNVRLMLSKRLPDLKLCLNLEKGVFNAAIQSAGEASVIKRWDSPGFVLLYTNRLRSIVRNLGNEVLRQKILDRTLKPHKLAFMEHQAMQPERWQSLIAAKKLKDENRYAPRLEASTDNFTCYKCRSKKCSYYQLQTRSADEPMTTFVTCIDCGNRWKC